MQNILLMVAGLSAKLAMITLWLILFKFLSKRLAKSGSTVFKKIDKLLMRIHKPAGYLLVIAGAIHGTLSINNIVSFVGLAGIICLLSCVGAIVCFIIRKKMTKPKTWLYTHRLLTVIAAMSFFMHVILVKI